MYNNMKMLTVYIYKQCIPHITRWKVILRPWSTKGPSKTCQFFNQ